MRILCSKHWYTWFALFSCRIMIPYIIILCLCWAPFLFLCISSFVWISFLLYFFRSGLTIWGDLGACCFPEDNHFYSVLSYILSNQLHYVGGTIRNEMWDGSTALLEFFCNVPVLVAPQTSNDVKQSADTQWKSIWTNCWSYSLLKLKASNRCSFLLSA